MVVAKNTPQRFVTAWPVSLRWRLLAVLLILAATITSLWLLSLGKDKPDEILVVAATERWTEGYLVGQHAVIAVPADLAPLFVTPDDLKGKTASVDVPEGTVVSAEMLRPEKPSDKNRTTTLMAFSVSASLWPTPGPTAGDPAVFASAPGGCAVAIERLAAVEMETSEVKVTVEATPTLAATLSDYEWWIWESPPGGWPQCLSSNTNTTVPTTTAAPSAGAQTDSLQELLQLGQLGNISKDETVQ